MMLIGERVDGLTVKLTANWSSALKRFKKAVEASGNGLTVEIDNGDGRHGTMTLPADWPFIEDMPGVGSTWKIYPNYYTNV